MNHKKIAFLFLVRKNHHSPKVWEYYFNNIDKQRYSIYCHSKLIPDQEFLKQSLIPNRIPTTWADISLVRATLLLLQNALRDIHNTFFILVSESCIPVQSFNSLYSFLIKTNKSLISYQNCPLTKLNRYQTLHLRMKGSIPFHHFKNQHQWMCLTREVVKKLITIDDTSLYKYMRPADEHYFINTILLYQGNKNIKNYKITFCKWGNSLFHPQKYIIINKQLLQQLKNQGFFFLRKVDHTTIIHNTLFERLKN
jgi:hypothetical protein